MFGLNSKSRQTAQSKATVKSKASVQSKTSLKSKQSYQNASNVSGDFEVSVEQTKTRTQLDQTGPPIFMIDQAQASQFSSSQAQMSNMKAELIQKGPPLELADQTIALQQSSKKSLIDDQRSFGDGQFQQQNFAAGIVTSLESPESFKGILNQGKMEPISQEFGTSLAPEISVSFSSTTKTKQKKSSSVVTQKQEQFQGFNASGQTVGGTMMLGPIISSTKQGQEEFVINSQRSIGSYEEDNDFNIDTLQKQNDEMQQRLQMNTTHSVTVNTITTDHGHSHTHGAEVTKFSYGSYLEEQEQRHSKQIETLYKQISMKESYYSEQITQLQKEKAELEQKLYFEISQCRELSSKHTIQIQEKEYYFQEQLGARMSELTAVRHDHELVRSQLSDLEQSYAMKQEQIHKYELQLKETSASYQLQMEGLQTRLQEFEKKYQEKEEQYRLSIHYKEQAEGEVSRFQSEVSLKEKKIVEKSRELESLQKRIIDIQSESKESVEHVRKTTQNTFKLQEQKITQVFEEKFQQQVKEIEQRYRYKFEQQEKSHMTSIKQVQSEVEVRKTNDKKLEFDLKSAHQQYRALQNVIEQKEQVYITEKTRLEKQYEEVRVRHEQTTMEHQNVLVQLQDQKQIEVERQTLVQGQRELEQKLSQSIQQIFINKNEIARERADKKKEIEVLQISFQEKERTYEYQLQSIKEQASSKDQQLQRFNDQVKMIRIESEQTESKLRTQCQQLQIETQELKQKYEVRIQNLNGKIVEVQQASQLEIEASTRTLQETQKAHMVEITQWKSKLSELQTQAKQEVRRLVEKKTYLESQRAMFNSEIKKLFEINAELERKLADARLELHAFSGQNEKISQSTMQEKEAVMLKAKEQEQLNILKIQEIQGLRDRISKMEYDNAVSVRMLHDQISEQEKRFSDKVYELQQVEAENADLQILVAKNSKSMMMSHKFESQTFISSDQNIEKYKEINENLEQHFNKRLHELQEKHALYESRETHFLALVKQFEVQRTQLQEGYAKKEQELQVKIKNFEETSAGAVSMGGAVSMSGSVNKGFAANMGNQEELINRIQFLESQCQAYIQQISVLKQATDSQEQELERQRTQSYQAMSKSHQVIKQYHALHESQTNLRNESSRISELEALQDDFNLSEEKLGNMKEQVGEYKKIETVLREQVQVLQKENFAYQQEITQLQTKIQFLTEENRILTERANSGVNKSIDSKLDKSFRSGSKTKSLFKNTNTAYMQKQQQSMNISGFSSQGSIEAQQQTKISTSLWYMDSFQALKGYEMSNTNASESSSKIEQLKSKPTSELEMIYLKSVDWSTMKNGQQKVLASLKFNFSDGTSSQEWGSRNYKTHEIYKFQNNGSDIAEIAYELGEHYILYVCFQDSKGKTLISCGDNKSGSRVNKGNSLTIQKGYKIVSAFGASSSQNQNNVAMIGFDFWSQKYQEVGMTMGVPQALEDEMPMVPDGFYMAKLESGQESSQFYICQGRFTLYGQEYQLQQIEGQISFKWGDKYGTIYQLNSYQSDGSVVWKVLNNPYHKQVIWSKKLKENFDNDLSGLYEIQVDGGTNVGKTVLSCNGLSSNSDGIIELSSKASSSKQFWWLEKLSNGFYNIKIDDESNNKNWLCASRETNRIEFKQKDQKNERMQWEITQIDGYFNIRVPKGMKETNTFMSCREDGYVDMWERDDSSGRQRWQLLQLINLKDVRPQVMVTAECSDRGFDQDAICLVSSEKSSKWCVKFKENQTWFKINFPKPICIYFYTMTLANDFPGRDPVRWSVEINSNEGKFKEVHTSQSKNPARFSVEKFKFEKPYMVRDIKFTYLQNRYTLNGDTKFKQDGDDGVNRLQLNYIGFWVPTNKSGVHSSQMVSSQQSSMKSIGFEDTEIMRVSKEESQIVVKKTVTELSQQNVEIL